MKNKKVDLGFMFGLEPKEAVKYLTDKGYRISRNWNDTWQEAHTKAFTVAKAMRLDILKDIREEVETALKEGLTLKEFQKKLKPKLVQRGWWGKLYNPETGKTEQLGSMKRLRTIYRTNLRTAYSTGKYKFQIDTAKIYPWWKYNATLDAKTRPEHRRLHGKIFKYDDPFWKYFYPPNDWGCRCYVTTLRDKDIIDRKLKTESSKGTISTRDVKINKKGDIKTTKIYKDPVTGNTVQIGPGWAYNPGQTTYFPNIQNYDDDIALQYLEGLTSSKEFNKHFSSKLNFKELSIGIAPEIVRKELKTKSKVINISSNGILHSMKHPEIKLNIFKNIFTILNKDVLGIVRSKKNSNAIIILNNLNNYYYATVYSLTEKKDKYIFLTMYTLGRKKDRALKKLYRLGKRLK